MSFGIHDFANEICVVLYFSMGNPSLFLLANTVRIAMILFCGDLKAQHTYVLWHSYPCWAVIEDEVCHWTKCYQKNLICKCQLEIMNMNIPFSSSFILYNIRYWCRFPAIIMTFAHAWLMCNTLVRQCLLCRFSLRQYSILKTRVWKSRFDYKSGADCGETMHKSQHTIHPKPKTLETGKRRGANRIDRNWKPLKIRSSETQNKHMIHLRGNHIKLLVEIR